MERFKKAMILRLVQKLFSYLFPPTCIVCGTEETQENLCRKCIENMLIHREQNRTWSLSLYRYRDHIVSTAIQHLKNYPDLSMVQEMLRPRSSMIYGWISGLAATSGTRDIVLVPIPLHRSRFLDRGYNQAEIIADAVVEVARKNHRLNIQITSSLIAKSNKTIKQATIHDRTERFKNIHGAFVMTDTALAQSLNNSIIVIIDDVTTTGGTLDEIKNLLSPYAKEVFAFTLGH